MKVNKIKTFEFLELVEKSLREKVEINKDFSRQAQVGGYEISVKEMENEKRLKI